MTISVAYTAADAKVFIQASNSSPARARKAARRTARSSSRGDETTSPTGGVISPTTGSDIPSGVSFELDSLEFPSPRRLSSSGCNSD